MQVVKKYVLYIHTALYKRTVLTRNPLLVTSPPRAAAITLLPLSLLQGTAWFPRYAPLLANLYIPVYICIKQ